MKPPEQLSLDFHAPAEDGYAAWQWDHEQAVKRIGAEWGLPINSRVRLKLTNIDSEFEGVLRLAEHPLAIDRRRPLALKLTPLAFSSVEIERCVAVE